MRLFLVLGLGLFRLRTLPAQANFGDLDPGQLSPVTDGAVITFPAAILERDDFLVFALLDYFAGHGRAFNQRRAVGDVIAVRVKKDIGENAFLARFFIEEIDIDDVSFRDAVLSAASLNNCVSHTKSRGKSRAKFHRCGALTSLFYEAPAPSITSVISPFAGCAS